MKQIIFYRKPTLIKTFVKDLKRRMTKPEKILRARLRWKKLDGKKFYRQKAIPIEKTYLAYDKYIIADFYHHPKKLIIEIDGSIHYRKDVREKDRMKEKRLAELWYTVVRYRNDEVYYNLEGVLENIRSRVNLRE